MSGMKHATAKKAASRTAEDGPQKCTICKVSLTTADSVRTHVNGKGHLSRLRSLQQQGTALDTQKIIVLESEKIFECCVCEITLWGTTKARHERTARHLRKERFLAIRATLEEAEKDKHGVFITPSGRDAFDLGLNATGSATLEFAVGVDSADSRIILRSATLFNAGRRQFH